MGWESKRIFVLVVSLVLGLLLLGGCGTGESENGTTPSDQGGTETTAPADTAAASEEGGMVDKGIVEIGQAVDCTWGDVTISQVTVATDLNSPEANAVLLTDADYEGDNTGTAAAGNEYLLITFTYTNGGDTVGAYGIFPVDLNLTDSSGTVYELTPTNSEGGLFNDRPENVPAGGESQVTAVYEVPAGETGLALTYEYVDWDNGGGVTFKVNIR
jgi:hypothetical protein